MSTVELFSDHQSRISSALESLASSDPVVREKARQHLVSIGPDVVVPLLQVLRGSNDRACWEAAKALGAIGHPAAASALAELLNHPNHDVRWVAAEALAAMGSAGLEQVLMTLLTKSGSVAVQNGAHHVLALFTHKHEKELLATLLTKFNAFEPAVAIPPAAFKALNALEKLKG
jgi:HEAT repeat protein